jgi:hypothetical protein
VRGARARRPAGFLLRGLGVGCSNPLSHRCAVSLFFVVFFLSWCALAGDEQSLKGGHCL